MKKEKYHYTDIRYKHCTGAKVNRDNKDDYNYGSGGSNINSVRYPSKKRNKKVWKKFYKLFPRLAERDDWDGKTSKKMK